MSIDDNITSKHTLLAALRPLAGRSLDVLEHWFDVELTYTSNAIEGSTLTRSETAIILEKGITIGGKPLKDHLEAIDHRDALAFVRGLAGRDEPLREGDVREIHRLVLARSDPAEAGRYSGHQRAAAGSRVHFPSAGEIAPLMGDLARWLREVEATPDSAFEAHYRLVTIHPFSDGHGRTARLLMNLLLLRAGYPPVAIGPDHRVAYLDALEARQVESREAPWRDFMAGRLDASLILYLDHLDKAIQVPAGP